MRRMLAWGVVVVGLVAALVLAPSLLTRSVAAWLTARTGVPITIAWMSWNPLLGRVSMHGIRLGPPTDETPMITLGDLRVTIALRSLVRGRLQADELVLVDPWVGLRRTASGDFNLSALFPAPPSSPLPVATPAATAPGDDRTFAVRRLRIEGGAVQFRDEATSPMLETSLYLEDIVADDLILDLSGKTNVTVHLESRLEREPLTLDLTYRAQAGDSSLRARLVTAGASLARTLLYVPVGWQQVSGTLDVALDYVHESKDGRLATHTLTAAATMHQVALVEPWASAPALRASRIRIPALMVDFVRQRTDLGVIRIDDFQAAIVRDGDDLHIPLMHGDEAPDTKWQTVLSAVELGTGELLLHRVIAGAEPEITARVRTGSIRQTADDLSFTLETDIAGGRIVVGGRSGGDAFSMRFDLDGLALPEFARQLRLPVAFATGRVDGSLLARFDGGPARISRDAQRAGREEPAAGRR